MSFDCPNCKAPLVVVQGSKYNPRDGWTVYCKNPRPACSMDDWAHGGTPKEAFQIFEYKCGKRDGKKEKTQDE